MPALVSRTAPLPLVILPPLVLCVVVTVPDSEAPLVETILRDLVLICEPFVSQPKQF